MVCPFRGMPHIYAVQRRWRGSGTGKRTHWRKPCFRLSVICCLPIHDVHWTFLGIAFLSIVCLYFPSSFCVSVFGDLRLLVSFVCPVNPPLHARESPLNLLVPEAVALKLVNASDLESECRYKGLFLCTSRSGLVDRSSNMRSEAGSSRWHMDEKRSHYDVSDARARSPLRQELGGSGGWSAISTTNGDRQRGFNDLHNQR